MSAFGGQQRDLLRQTLRREASTWAEKIAQRCVVGDAIAQQKCGCACASCWAWAVRFWISVTWLQQHGPELVAFGFARFALSRSRAHPRKLESSAASRVHAGCVVQHTGFFPDDDALEREQAVHTGWG